MAERIERNFLRQDLAEFLEDLARQLRLGTLELEGEKVGVPEQVRAVIEFREKMGCIQGHLLFRWSRREGAELQLLPPRCRRREEFRELKHHLAEVFGELLEVAHMWLLPAESLVMRFMELSREFVLLADPEWEDEINTYMAHVENLFYAVKTRQLEPFLREINRLKDLVRSCHQEKR